MTRRFGPFALMQDGQNSCTLRVEANGSEAWGAFDPARTKLLLCQEALKFAANEGVEGIELLSASPDFPDNMGNDASMARLASDARRLESSLNELVYVPKAVNDDRPSGPSGDIARFIGLHVGQIDFYYRFRHTGGRDSFASLAFPLALLRDDKEVDEDNLHAIESSLTQEGAESVESLLVTREICKPWPRKTAAAAYIQVLSRDEHLIFGPFETPEELKAFESKMRLAPGMGESTTWKSEYARDKRLRGKEITQDILSLQAAEMDVMDYVYASIGVIDPRMTPRDGDELWKTLT